MGADDQKLVADVLMLIKKVHSQYDRTAREAAQVMGQARTHKNSKDSPVLTDLLQLLDTSKGKGAKLMAFEVAAGMKVDHETLTEAISIQLDANELFEEIKGIRTTHL